MGLSTYLASVKRIQSKFGDLSKKSMRVNQDMARELSDLLREADRRLRELAENTLKEHTKPIEPLHYITKSTFS